MRLSKARTEMWALKRKHGVMCCSAFWYRFLPLKRSSLCADTWTAHAEAHRYCMSIIRWSGGGGVGLSLVTVPGVAFLQAYFLPISALSIYFIGLSPPPLPFPPSSHLKSSASLSKHSPPNYSVALSARLPGHCGLIHWLSINKTTSAQSM